MASRSDSEQMSPKDQMIKSIEQRRGEYSFVPEATLEEAMELPEEKQGIDYEFLDSALATAEKYWRKYLEEEAEVVTHGDGSAGLHYEIDMPPGYKLEVSRDLQKKHPDLETREISEIVHILTTDQEDYETPHLENVPHTQDPKWTPENKNYPSMFQ
ncbi:MAG: hypothetical protein BRC28_00510 [Nanohaloarchaea archaeon SW_4_43_9]|nr:MAG: hypothetical protein BRC28_00510 [Nanohaloarchaea archaeon SW_4_43_9]